MSTDTIERAAEFEAASASEANHELNGEAATAAAETDHATADGPALAPVGDLGPPPEPLAIREARHYTEIQELAEEVYQTQAEFLVSKETTKELKQKFDGLQSDLRRLVRRGPDPQKRLPLADPATESAAIAAPLENHAWKAVKIEALECGKSATSKLETHGLETLGQLQEFWTAGKDLKDLKGIGEETAAKIADAYADFGAKHPELWEVQAASGIDSITVTHGDESVTVSPEQFHAVAKGAAADPEEDDDDDSELDSDLEE